MSDPQGAPQGEVKQITLDGAQLREDALRRGVTATVLILPFADDSRHFVIFNHAAGVQIQRSATVEDCRALFGTDRCGLHEQVTTFVRELADLNPGGHLD